MTCSDYLATMANDIVAKIISKRPVEETLRVLQDTLGGRFLRVTALPDEWETLVAVFVIVEREGGIYDFNFFINSPEVAQQLAARGCTIG